MSRPPLRLPLEQLREGERLLHEEASRYATRVHRRGPGDALLLFDPSTATEAEARISSVERGACRVLVGPPRPASVRAARSVILLQAVGKGDKLDAIVRDATELGATRVVPVLSARTTVRLEGRGKSERWERIALEAARQCGRGDCVRVEPLTPLVQALAHYVSPAPGLSLVLDPSSARAAGGLLRELPAHAPLTFVVGPEGGLEEEEIAEAEARGYTPASLGPFVLRTETVCAALLGALLLGAGTSPRSS